MELVKANNTLAIFNPAPGTKAVEVRRKMLEVPEVNTQLSKVDGLIFVASTKILISEIAPQILADEVKKMLRFIALDVGFRGVDGEEWAYSCARIISLLSMHYSGLTLSEVKLAFELATLGELNEFLPKDGQGQPDKNHYQQFNAEYLAKILNAYKERQGRAISKAYEVVPRPEKQLSEEEKKGLNNSLKYDLVMHFLYYKYHGVFQDIFSISEMLFYSELERVGLAEKIEINETHRAEAMGRALSTVANSFGSQFKGNEIRNRGEEHPDVKNLANIVGRRNALKASYDYIIKEEIQILKYVKSER